MLEIEQCVNNRIVALRLMYSSDTLFACEMNKRPVYKKNGLRHIASMIGSGPSVDGRTGTPYDSLRSLRTSGQTD